MLGSLLLIQICFASDPALEKKYIEKRDAFIRAFEKAKDLDHAEDKRALGELERSLSEALGPIEITGISGQGRTKFETLRKKDGRGHPMQ